MTRLIYLVFLLFSLSITETLAQAISLDYFNATENNEEVFLKWAITRGETCNGILITRSTDSLNFEAVGKIDGVCGSPDFQQPYSFIDETPVKNKIIYYRLELGISSFSNIISIELIEKNGQGYQVRPQPLKEDGQIFFSNPDGKKWYLQVYNLNGKNIYQSSTIKESIQLKTDQWSSGLYVFVLSSEKEKIRGKLIVSP
ncbi:MAG: T9SS type A sorting domain-containing protein [Bacteroidales bacterium]|nr:T9SS type A sorting domain-containing protein [Bacteroidales bacterium]